MACYDSVGGIGGDAGANMEAIGRQRRVSLRVGKLIIATVT